MTEQERLESVSTIFNDNWGSGVYSNIVEFTHDAIAPYFLGPSGLEVGCANGMMTKFLSTSFWELHVVDAVEAYVQEAMLYAHGGTVSLFEEFEPEEEWDTIVMAHFLEHVEDPVAILNHASKMLAPGGRVIVVVPNADSIHRRLGVEMGLLNKRTDLNTQDRMLGHRRVYTMEALRADAAEIFDIVASGGIFLKPFSFAQMEGLSDEVMRGLYQVGQDLPTLCSEIYVVLEKP